MNSFFSKQENLPALSRMKEVKTEGKIFLSNFDLEAAEKAIVNNIIKNYNRKITEKVDYDYIRLRLKMSPHGKAFLHQIKGNLKTDNKILTASAADYNLFSALADVLERLLNEAEHRMRTTRQIFKKTRRRWRR